MEKPKIYLDTNVLKASKNSIRCFRPKKIQLGTGKNAQIGTIYDIIEYDQNEKIKNPEMKAEISVLPRIADLAKSYMVELFVGIETHVESMTLPKSTCSFFGAPLTNANSPLKYGRILMDGLHDARQMQIDFLLRINNNRFKQIQKYTGAFQGKKAVNNNQLLDAFHIWCAEHNRCNFFLTLDFKLIRILKTNRLNLSLTCVKPSELLNHLENFDS